MAKINQLLKDILNLYPNITRITYSIWAIISIFLILSGQNDAVVFGIVKSYIYLTIGHIVFILFLWAAIKIFDYHDYY